MATDGYIEGDSYGGVYDEGIIDDGSMSHIPIEEPMEEGSGTKDASEMKDASGAEDAVEDLGDSLGDDLGASVRFSSKTKLVFTPKKRSKSRTRRSNIVVGQKRTGSKQSQVRFVRSQRKTSQTSQRKSKPTMRLIFAPTKK